MLPLLFSLGIVYLFALGAGRLSAAIGLPRVTGYLLVGVLAGPTPGDIGLPALISHDHLNQLAFLHDVILGLIVFTIGGSFSLGTLRQMGMKRFRISAVEIGMTGLLVGLGTAACGISPLAAGFLAIMAVTTAPAATQMVMREYQSEGPLSDTILPLIGINNLVAIIAFILLKENGLAPVPNFSSLAAQLSEPLVLGVFMGMAVAIMDQRFTRPVERQMLVLAAVAVTAGMADYLDNSAIFATLVAGMVAVNASPYEKRMLKDLTAIDYPLYVLFFIMAGATLHLDALGHMGLVGLGYVAMRLGGKYFGCRLGARMAGVSPIIRTWLGPAMLAQAGLAIGLAEELSRMWPDQGASVQTIILSSVVVFEVLGPLLTRVALVNAGEVTVFNLLAQRSPVGFGEGLHQVLGHFGRAVGISHTDGPVHSGEIRVRHIMRRNVEVISNRASFREVLKTLGHSRYDRLPVVNDWQELVGVIKYADIANTLFDPCLHHLVVADDIATDTHLKLNPEDTLETAMQALKDYPNDVYLLVVEKENPRQLAGVVRHNDLLSSHFRSHSAEREGRAVC
ncbi:cation:proton antiporter [Desulfosarcina ovata]|uniref:Sodium/hydrogen exchanger n=1 Tax=Desulfosarcina ovata subsp. ovata TaxID=2752305 RepID=A0A5K8A853_9BACT|nr:cation:proton antiporter [Desulfosarcina ovata]BBO88659.1 sodium/hydrogen exchanger [Desulfosarcina ovata subsp. ovata]